METLSTLTPQCQAKKAMTFTGKKSESAAKNKAITNAATEAILGNPWKGELEREYDLFSFPTAATKAVNLAHAKDLVQRFVDGNSMVKNVKRIATRPRSVTVGGMDVWTDPDYVEIYDPFIENNISYDGRIHIVKIHKGKLTSKRASTLSVAKLAMLEYAHDFVSTGKRVMIDAVDVYLTRQDDSSRWSEHPSFKSMWEMGGNNYTVYEEDYMGGTSFAPSVLEDFKKSMEELHQGKTPSTTECKECMYNALCHYEKPPLAVPTSKKISSPRAISFTPSQEEAVEYEKGILRINAGAGTGKTVVLVMRTINLLLGGTKPEEILLITFTNTAAEEMRERIKIYNDDIGTGEDVSGITIMTFNAFGNEIIKRNYKRFGFSEPPVVIDNVQRLSIIAKLLSVKEVDGLNYDSFYANNRYVKGAVEIVSEVFSIIKNENTFDEKEIYQLMAAGSLRFFSRKSLSEIISLYDEYDKVLREKNLIEYVDQERLLFELLYQDPYYLESLGYKHILVDEAQDSSRGQMKLLRMFPETKQFESLMFVGDDSQSIMGTFRDVSPEFLINFAESIGRKHDDIYLLENYRCVPEIIELANKINKLNTIRVDKNLIAMRPSAGVKPVLHGFHKKADETKYIIDGIKQELANGTEPSDIAVLCATKAELRHYAAALGDEGIASVILAPEREMENSRIAGAISLVRALSDVSDEVSILTYENALHSGAFSEDFTNEDKKKELLEEGRNIIQEINNAENKKETLLKHLENITFEDEMYQQFYDRLKKFDFGGICDYLAQYEIFGEKNEFRRTADYPGVVLATCHSSKGLEWPVVFLSMSGYDTNIVNLHNNTIASTKHREEKRRLLFVSITRARDRLYISSEYVAYKDGKKNVYNLFFAETAKALDCPIDFDKVEAEAAEEAKKRRKKGEKKGNKEEDIA